MGAGHVSEGAGSPPDPRGPDRAFPDQARIHELVARGAQGHPRRPALVTDDGIAYSHEGLDLAAGRTAAALRDLGVGRGTSVGLLADHDPEAVRGLLGVLRAGGTYVPTDPRWPHERLAQVLRQVDALALLTDRAHMGRAAELMESIPSLRHVLILDEDRRDGRRPPAGATELHATAGDPVPASAAHCGPADIAYCIFTSGSTGRPKGVMVQHRAVANLIDWVNRGFGVSEEDRLLFVTSFAFDLSVYDMFGVLAAGGSVHLARDAHIADPDLLLDILEEEPITFWDSAPAAMAYVLAATVGRAVDPGAPLRRVFLSGDWIPVSMPDDIRRSFARAEVIALGGATEATVWSNSFRVGTVDPEWPSIPYGRPMQNARYYVLDDRLDPLPVGQAGDLHIAGECLALGYHGDPVLTARKFLPDPFASAPGQRMYRTGDRACWMPDGNLRFLGRDDHQVKIRGYRVELGEIEGAMAQHAAVREAVVTVTRTGGENHLSGYYSCQPDRVEPSELRAHLLRHLPEYMVPGSLTRLEAMPMTQNGKVDRRALSGRAAPGR